MIEFNHYLAPREYDDSFYQQIIDLDTELFNSMANQPNGYKIDRSQYPRLTPFYVRQILENERMGLIYAIDITSYKLVGICLYEPQLDFHKQTYNMYVYLLVTTKDYKNKGIGRELINTLQLHINTHFDGGNIHLWSYKYNDANEFYKKLGFKNTIGDWLYLENKKD